MATSGSTGVWVTDWDLLRFTWSQKSQSVADNTTTISWKMELIATDYGYISSSASKKWSVTINNITYNGNSRVGINNNSTKTLASGTTTIKHDSGGNKSFTYSFSQTFDIDFNGWIGTISGSGSGNLEPIRSASTLTITAATLGSSSMFNISSSNSTFKHRILYACGDSTGYVAGSATTYFTGSSTGWIVPEALARWNTSGTSVVVTYTLQTYTSSGNHIGTTTKSVTHSMKSSVAPTCTMTLEDITGVDDIYGSPVQGLSKIKITVNPSLAYESPIVSYLTTANGASYTTAVATTGVLKSAGDSHVTATVTDKRGRKGSTSYTMKVQAYTAPNVSKLTVHRTDSNGAEDEQGDYIRVVFSAAVSALGNKNTAQYILRYKKPTDSTYTEVSLTSLNNMYTVSDADYIFAADSNSSYDVEITAKDRHNSVTRRTSASTAFTLINWGADGTSMGVGKVAEKENTLEVALDAHIYGSTILEGNRYAFQPSTFDDVGGYTLLAVVTLNTPNVDAPIVFVINRRGALCPMHVYVQFASSSDTTDPTLASITYEGDNFGAFMVKGTTSTWKLYVDNTGGGSNPCLQDWYTTDNQMARLSVTFPSEQVASLPSPYYRATPAKMQSLLDFIYPVGSVYISYSHVSPADLFGGTWVRIENAFLWGCDASGTIGQTGGERTHALTITEMPNHSHGSVYSGNASGAKTHSWLASGGSNMAYGTVATGGGEPHNNMPPYIQVSIWRRTA